MRVVLGDDEAPIGPHAIGKNRTGVGAHLETPAQRAGGHGGGEVGHDGRLARLVQAREVDHRGRGGPAPLQRLQVVEVRRWGGRRRRRGARAARAALRLGLLPRSRRLVRLAGRLARALAGLGLCLRCGDAGGSRGCLGGRHAGGAVATAVAVAADDLVPLDLQQLRHARLERRVEGLALVSVPHAVCDTFVDLLELLLTDGRGLE